MVGFLTQITLDVPETLDADLYIHTGAIPPTGDPILLASSTSPGLGDDESLVFTPPPGMDCYLTVKQIQGFGQASLHLGASDVNDSQCPQTTLLGAAPNPFNPRTSIKFNVGQDERVAVTVCDLAGRQVVVLADQVFAAGPQKVVWEGCDG